MPSFMLPTRKSQLSLLTIAQHLHLIQSENQRIFQKMIPTNATKNTLVYHLLIMSISINELKKRLLLTLQDHNLWMRNDSLKAKEMAVIAFIWKAPTRMLHRLTFAKMINDYLRKKIKLNYEQQNLLKHASDDAELPDLLQVFVNICTIKYGNANQVETKAPTILANKPYSRLEMREPI
jgi:hypothetical protein